MQPSGAVMAAVVVVGVSWRLRWWWGYHGGGGGAGSGTLFFDLPDLPHGLLEDGTLVRLHVEAVDVGEVGRDELGQLLDVLALLLPAPLVTPAGGGWRSWGRG